ncbi:hypothetical protein TWF506_010159 [Arthrobotrys conoides]|uniref:Methyltransferase domain-containing protein n=1 Tax=Arthrobotrys conoides TaxID=74498 RepID=A0AAN8RLW0_9PEZI
MRICAFQSSYEDSDFTLRDIDASNVELDNLTPQHTIKSVFVHKTTAEEEINAAVAEGYDLYINLMRGTSDGQIAGIEETRYLESLALRTIGIKTQQPKTLKKEFAASGCRYGGITVSEAENLLSLGGEETKDKDCFKDDFYTVTVIEIGDGCVALNPCVCGPPNAPNQKFPASESTVSLQPSLHSPEQNSTSKLFERLQSVAVEAFHASSSKGNRMGCDVDIRVQANEEIVVLEVKPLPAPFLPGRSSQDLAAKDFPGGYPALINIFISNQTLCHPIREVIGKVADVYDKLVVKYDTWGASHSEMQAGTYKSIDGFDFSGTCFDLACGTGVFGRALAKSKTTRGDTSVSRIMGFDISPGMAEVCRKSGHYDLVHLDPMQTCLINHRLYHDGDIDHIVCFSGCHFLSEEEFSFVLALCFILAKKSITFSVDEITDTYNEAIAKRGMSFAHSINHIANMKAFGVPKGWRLARHHRQFSWTSPTTQNDDIYTNYFRFEKIEDYKETTMLAKFEL